jgi:hypothetical protein
MPLSFKKKKSEGRRVQYLRIITIVISVPIKSIGIRFPAAADLMSTHANFWGNRSTRRKRLPLSQILNLLN